MRTSKIIDLLELLLKNGEVQEVQKIEIVNNSLIALDEKVFIIEDIDKTLNTEMYVKTDNYIIQRLK